MHDIEDPQNTIDKQVAESPELLGHECDCCRKILGWKYYRKDSSFSEGYKRQCMDCESQPRLSLEEHTSRLREKNLNSHGVKKQRWENQDDYRGVASRRGKTMPCGEFISRTRKLLPNLFVVEGNIIGELAVYVTFGKPQADGTTYEYIGYIPEGLLPEFSIYLFDDDKDILIKESQRGWRTPLLRLIEKGHLTEEQVKNEFGEALGPASTIWHRKLHKHRNKKQ